MHPVALSLGDLCEVFRVSAPLKEQYAKVSPIIELVLQSIGYIEVYLHIGAWIGLQKAAGLLILQGTIPC